MFSWLRNKQLKEQKKLLYQNSSAAKVLAGVLSAAGDAENGFRMLAYEERNRRIASSVGDDELVSPSDLKNILDMNRELRSWHQQALRMSRSFDETYRPLQGWDSYYGSN